LGIHTHGLGDRPSIQEERTSCEKLAIGEEIDQGNAKARHQERTGHEGDEFFEPAKTRRETSQEREF
jgi:hypothetical protein